MGGSIGGHLLAAGWPVTVTDVRTEAVERMAAAGATVAATAAEVAAASDAVLVVVVDDEQVRQVVLGTGGALDGAPPGTIIAICASVHPSTCRDLAGEAAARGVTLIDVALARGERGAELGRLLLLCGGPEAAIQRCRSAFDSFSSDIVRVGGVGAGQVAKTVNNVLLWSSLRADLEALRLGRALGVEPSVLRAAVALGSGANRPLSEWGEHRLRWPGKDLEVALALAEEAGVDVPLLHALAPLIGQVSVDELRELL